MDELPNSVWRMIISMVVPPGGKTENPTEPTEPKAMKAVKAALMHLATVSKSHRARVITFLNECVSVTTEIEAIVSDPARVFAPHGSLPSVRILTTDRAATNQHQQQQEWSLLERARSVGIRVSCAASDLAWLMHRALNATALTVIFNTPNVSFGPEPLDIAHRIRCLIVDRAPTTGRREAPAPVFGFLRCPGVTHCAISGNVRVLPSLACIHMPNVQVLLIGGELGSMDGLERLTCIRSLAVKDPGAGREVLRTICHIGSLVHLVALDIGFSSRDVFLRFASAALPSLRSLRSLTVCTPSGAEDMLLHHAHEAGSCLTALESLSLLGTPSRSWPTLAPARSIHTGLPNADRLTKLRVYSAWYSSWSSHTGLASITELSLAGIRIFREPAMDTVPVTSLASLGLPFMSALTVLKIDDLVDIQSLHGLYGLHGLTSAGLNSVGLTTLVITGCANLTDIGLITTMHSLSELSIIECGDADLPPLTGLTRLASLSIDLGDDEIDEEDDDSDHNSQCFTEIPPIPPSLKRLCLNSPNGACSVESQALSEYLSDITTKNTSLLELSVRFWDKTVYH
jgi:hypothetical protein